MNRTLRSFILVLLLLFLVTLSFGLGYFSAPRSPATELPLIQEAWRALSQDYVDPKALEPQALERGAIRGLIDALKDPYTAYLDPEHYQMELSSLQGKFEGIGAQVTKRDKDLIVILPFPGSPAEKAGLRSGDKVLQVNGEDISGLSLNEAVLRIRGPRGTSVQLLILHEGAKEPQEVAVVRAEIKVESVTVSQREEVAIIRIISFNETTPRELREVLSRLPRQTRALLLDLRANPGGLLSAVVEMAGQFLEEGQVVLYEVDRQGERQPWTAPDGGLALDYPLAVLVDKYSASGSEVLTGALQDHKRAAVFGTTTFGKGSVNIIRNLSDGSALYITRNRWLTPQGRPIEGKGLDPDFTVETTPQDQEQGRDPVLEAALQHLRGLLTTGEKVLNFLA